MSNQPSQINALNIRVWFVQGGVYPTRTPEFLALGKISTDPSITVGEATKVSAPDPNNFNKDIQLGSVPGTKERATVSVSSRYQGVKSKLMEWKNLGCRVDIFALVGKCGNPQDFSEGGEKHVYFPDGRISAYNIENFGAFGADENNPTNDSVDMTSQDFYEFLYMRQDQIGSSVTTREIYTVDVVPGDDCDDCPDQFSKIIATMAGASATPGTQPSLLYSADKGESWNSQTISSLFSNENVTEAAILGDYFLLISNIANEIHWTSITELFEGVNIWNQVTTGFVASKNPNAMWALDARHVWIVGNGGYIYFAQDYQTQVVVQDAGVATTQHLRSVHAFDINNVLVVGDSNAVIFTSNGGSTWETITGPSVGVNLGACWMWDPKTWFVGEGSGGNGKLWLTVNAGITWTQVGLPGTYNRFDKIMFISEAEGYITARAGGQSYILRTITAGNKWAVLPSGKRGTPIPNSYLRDLAVTGEFLNTVYAAGLAQNGTAGILVKMTG